MYTCINDQLRNMAVVLSSHLQGTSKLQRTLSSIIMKSSLYLHPPQNFPAKLLCLIHPMSWFRMSISSSDLHERKDSPMPLCPLIRCCFVRWCHRAQDIGGVSVAVTDLGLFFIRKPMIRGYQRATEHYRAYVQLSLVNN